MKVAVCQTNMSWTIEENVATIIKNIEMAAEASADLALFTECAITGYHRKVPTLCNYDDLQGALDQLREASERCGVPIIVGTPLMPDSADGKIYNAAVLLGSSEEVVFSKVGLTDAEKQFFTPGSSRVTTTVAGKKLSLMFCREVLDKEEMLEAYQPGSTDFIVWPSYIKWDADPSETDYIDTADYQSLAEELNTTIVNVNAANALNDPSLRGLGGSRIYSKEQRISLKADEEDFYLLQLK